ncbi:MAG: VanZ family protein [Patescibacteria group bacterium]|jgi:VanZ family protein
MSLIKKWGPVVFMMAVIFCFSSMKGNTVDALGLGKESYHINGHFFLFLALGLTLYRAVRSYPMSLAVGVLYGITDEVHQVFVPGRTAGPFDVFVDSMGVLISLGLIWLITRLKTQKN